MKPNQSAEIIIEFASADKVRVKFLDSASDWLEFTNPVTEKDREQIRWYIETYAKASLAEPDDVEAARIRERLPEIGTALFNAVMASSEAVQRFFSFRNSSEPAKVVTISSQDAAILSLPWELLHEPQLHGTFLFRQQPRVSIRRKIANAAIGRAPFEIEPKRHIHILFVVSRPTDAGFIDPRTDPRAVLDAIEKQAHDRITFEFLRPATLNTLVDRLDDQDKPTVDILHFDGHGVFRQVTEETANQNPGLYGTGLFREIRSERQLRNDPSQTGKPVGIGFLLFEKGEEDRTKHLISAQDLADNLFDRKVGLIVLSACQSASIDETGDPMASVAGKLTTTGIPAILAMTHSVLVETTRVLFGRFYESLAKGRTITTALDDARTFLANNREKHEVRRGQSHETLIQADWFVPALFQRGENLPLLMDLPSDEAAATLAKLHNLRQPHEAGFFGRKSELWEIERSFADGKTRRISITGFGGQGKTELAVEAGRWLLRTGMFQRAVFVDYAGVQSEDARSVAVSTIGMVLEESQIDHNAVSAAFAQTPTLLILDNLENVVPEGLPELLDAAVAWSEAGDSRVLLTSRLPDFEHPDYRVEGTRIHRRIQLTGLGSASQPGDSLEWFAELSKLYTAEVPPPKRDELIELFDRVAFHPLSIAVLVQQLKSRTPKQLGERLEQLLSDDAVSAAAQEDDGTPASLVASLELSLERLSEEERNVVRRLGVFQGGAMEDNLLAITGLGESEYSSERLQLESLLAALESKNPHAILSAAGLEIPGNEFPPELVARLSEGPHVKKMADELSSRLARLPPSEWNQKGMWPKLRQHLEAAGLIEQERITNFVPPYIRFHPTLAQMLSASFDPIEHADLKSAHCTRYCDMAEHLYLQDFQNPHLSRALAVSELPNLLSAVSHWLESDLQRGPDLIDGIRQLLQDLGMVKEWQSLYKRYQKRLEYGEQDVDWFRKMFSEAEQKRATGFPQQAAESFSQILVKLRNDQIQEQVTTIERLGRTYLDWGRLDLAEETLSAGLRLASTDPSCESDIPILELGLADSLRQQGHFDRASSIYKDALGRFEEDGNLRNLTMVKERLATTSVESGQISEGIELYYEVLGSYERLREPGAVALVQNRLGAAFTHLRQWPEAERHFRDAARIREQLGQILEAAMIWKNLATVSEKLGNCVAAEQWLRKALDGFRSVGNEVAVSLSLFHLADLVSEQQNRQSEAFAIADEAATSSTKLDPNAVKIWDGYATAASIALKCGKLKRAAEFRRLARQAIKSYPGLPYELEKFRPLIVNVVNAVRGDKGALATVDDVVENVRNAKGEGRFLVNAVERILKGDRNVEALVEKLTIRAPIIEAILADLTETDPSLTHAAVGN